MKDELKIGRKKYLIYIDSDDQKEIKKFTKKFKRAMRWSKVVTVPKGVVEVYRR